MRISYAICATPQREQQATQLSQSLGGIPVALDQDRHGQRYHGQNHDRALILANTVEEQSDWICVLEDDAEPVTDFHTQMVEALTVCPTSAASFYLGTQRDPRRRNRLEQLLPEDPHWIVADSLLHAVCFAIRTPLLHELLTTVENVTRMDADQRYGWGLRRMGGYQIAHTTCSLVDHLDGPPVITHRADGQPRDTPRKALKVGGRDLWNNSYLTL